ncbi:MAG: HAD family phosphatase, partial [Firmicutes bacterium]|nr:HAD family phosphatase [Bacillota bacterium]
MIKNIVFDMGQVMMKFDEDYFIDRLGIDDPEDRRMLKTEIFDSVEWVRMDRGSLKDWEAFDIIKERLPERLRGYAEKLILHWFEPVVPVDGMAGLAAELKSKGYRIYLLSNASHRQKEYWKSVPGSELFDGSVVSADYLIMKPQPEIYRLLLDK